MPVDSKPQGGDKAMPPPFKKPLAPQADEGGHEARDSEDSSKALANHELDEQTTLARPPLGN